MDVWFSIEEEPPPRGAKASWRNLKTFVSAPPERVRRAFALLTRTYHGCRLLRKIAYRFGVAQLRRRFSKPPKIRVVCGCFQVPSGCLGLPEVTSVAGFGGLLIFPA